jgi:hypothetical protein
MAGEDLTLRIGGDAQGATQALREAELAVRQFQGQTMFGGAGFADVTGQTSVLGENVRIVGAGMRQMQGAAKEAGEGLAITRGQAGQLAATLMQLGVIPPQITSSLRYLLWQGLTPTTAGFAAAIFIVQGLTAAYRALEEEAERAKKKMLEVSEAHAQGVAKLEGVQRIKGPLTAERAGELRWRQLGLMMAGMPEEKAAEMLEEVERRRSDMPVSELIELGYAWQARTEAEVGKKAARDTRTFTRQFLGPNDPRRAKLADAGEQAVNQLSGAREGSLRALAVQVAEARLGTRDLLMRDFAAAWDVSLQEANERITHVEIAEGLTEIPSSIWADLFHPGRHAETIQRLRSRAAMLGLGAAVTKRPFEAVHITNVGTNLSINHGGEPRDFAASGPVRGPAE